MNRSKNLKESLKSKVSVKREINSREDRTPQRKALTSRQQIQHEIIDDVAKNSHNYNNNFKHYMKLTNTRSQNYSMMKSLNSSNSILNFLPFDLPPILDTSLDEESLSPVEDCKTCRAKPVNISKISETGNISFGSSFSKSRQSLVNGRINKTSLGIRINKKSIIRFNKKKLKIKDDENARKHLVRSHLTEMYSKILTKVKSQQRDKRYISKILKAKH